MVRSLRGRRPHCTVQSHDARRRLSHSRSRAHASRRVRRSISRRNRSRHHPVPLQRPGDHHYRRPRRLLEPPRSLLHSHRRRRDPQTRRQRPHRIPSRPPPASGASGATPTSSPPPSTHTSKLIVILTGVQRSGQPARRQRKSPPAKPLGRQRNHGRPHPHALNLSSQHRRNQTCICIVQPSGSIIVAHDVSYTTQ